MITDTGTIKAIHHRISRAAVISLDAKIDEVFPLFGPVREKDWAEGWNPEIIYCDDPLVEQGMVFRTKGIDEDYIWTLTGFMPADYKVEYTVHTSSRVWFIRVECKDEGHRTSATVTYTYTAITADGIRLNLSAMEKTFEFDLGDWEVAINNYLRSNPKSNFNNQKT